MATRRTSFEKLQRDRDKKARAAAKQERRQGRQAEPSSDVADDDEPQEPQPGGELSAAELLVEVERIHKQFDAKQIDFETFEERKADLLSRLPVD